MEAIRITRFGGPEVLVLEDVSIPTPGPGQVLINVESVAVNFADVKRRRNDPYPFPTMLPFIPGSEVAGTIESLGPGVDGPVPGTPVFALSGDDGSNGYAQFALANASQVIPIPPGLSADVASGLVVAGSAAMLILKESARLAGGDIVLVQGAAGGVGSYAVQIAKILGASTVIGAASTAAKRDRVLALGADFAIDYTQSDWTDHVRDITGGRGVDIVLEMAGGAVFAQSLSCLAPFGRAVVYGSSSGDPLQFSEKTVLSLFYNPSPNQSLVSFNLGLWFGLRMEHAVDALQTLIGLVLAGQVKPQIGHVLPLREAAQAHWLLQERHSTGKIILKPWVVS